LILDKETEAPATFLVSYRLLLSRILGAGGFGVATDVIGTSNN